MHCPDCGAAIPNGWAFCRQCGTAQTHTTTRPDTLALVPDPKGGGHAAAVEGGAGDEGARGVRSHCAAAGRGPERAVPSAGTANGSGPGLEHTAHTETGIPELMLAHETGALVETTGAPRSQAWRPARPWQTWVLASALALAIAATSTLGWQLYTRNNQLASTRATLASTQSDLETRSSGLASAAPRSPTLQAFRADPNCLARARDASAQNGLRRIGPRRSRKSALRSSG
jgi:hypothetical protein